MRVSVLTFFLLWLPSTTFSQAKRADINYPTDEEIRLILNQSERALEEYKSTIGMEASLPSYKNDQASLANLKTDEEVYTEGMKLISALKRNPNGFHALGGFLLFSALDDGARNAALCSNTAMTDVAKGLMGTNKRGQFTAAGAISFVDIGQNCLAASNLLFTVSESLHALMVRELNSEGELREEATQALNGCNAVLKQKAGSKR